MASMMSLRTVLNSSLGSTEVLVASGIGELRARMVVGSGAEGFETVDLTSKEGDNLFGAAPPTVVAGKSAESGVDMILLLEVM